MIGVAALFQIYLPYFLPRTPEWSEGKNFQFQFDVEGHLVNVHPRRTDEKLFPTSIDENLSQAKLNLNYEIVAPVDAPAVSMTQSLTVECDSLRRANRPDEKVSHCSA